jgi:hypothetical protein
MNLPQELHVYHSLYPLDFQQEKSSQLFGHPTSVYKAMCTLDGRTYALRRIEGMGVIFKKTLITARLLSYTLNSLGFRLMNEVAMSTIENWRRIRHANIVSVREAFTTKAFGDHCKHGFFKSLLEATAST